VRIPGSWFNGPVDVEPALAADSDGETHGPKQRIRQALTVEKRRQVRTSNESGTLVVEYSTAQVYVQRDKAKPLGSYMTIWPGTPDERRARVLGVERYKFNGLIESAVHLLE
jgi:hypothetical protein